MPQVLRDYTLLRSAIMEVLEAIGPEVMAGVHRAIDQAVVLSVQYHERLQ